MHPRRIFWILLLAGSLGVAAAVGAEETPEPAVGITPVGCSSCNSGLLPAVPAPTLPGLLPGGVLGTSVGVFPDALPGVLPGALPDGPGCACSAGCVPGRKPCEGCLPGKTVVGRFLGALYESICCQDPCYDPKWYPLADSAFYTAAVRPVTQMRFRNDSGINFLFPDRSEFFWARADGKGKGPRPTAPFRGEPRLRYNDLTLITEGGTGTATLVVETPYRSIQPEDAPHAAGFADISIAAKTLLFDSELLQISMQFKTFLPTGNFTKGLGTGHVSLEPTLLLGLKLSPVTYLQTQLSEWIPLGGDPDYAGAILHYHLSLNQELFRIVPDVPVIMTGEFNGWSFQDGLYTDPLLGPQKSSGTTYATVGGGVRLFVCDKIDFGLATAIAITYPHFAQQLYTLEFRVRF